MSVSGSKNAALPIMVAALLTDEPVELVGVPEIEDTERMAAMLRHVGASVDKLAPGNWRIHAASLTTCTLGADLTQRLRGSFLLLGALVARSGEAGVAKPGGDDIGMRRVEQHLEGLRLMGATFAEGPDAYSARAKRLHGAHIYLDIPTVTGTENLIMAATLAEGITVISNAAREPHVVDLARCLAGMGARISGAGTERIVVEGSNHLLHGTRHVVTTDYIEAGTYMMMAAATRGDVVVDHVRTADIHFVINKLRAAGVDVVEGAEHVRVRGGPMHAVDVTTWPHPGFATDLQSQFVALMTQAEGMSRVSEAIFENRFHHVKELVKLGAKVEVEGRSAVVRGPMPLHGAKVRVSDIRSGAALVIAGLCAEGITELDDVYHLDRGYQDLESKLRHLGADVERRIVDDATTLPHDLRGVIGD